MSHKQNKIKKSNEGRMSEEYVVRRSRLSDIVAVFVCIALALAVWTVIMNTEDSDQVFVVVKNPQPGYAYELSQEHIEIKGTVAALRHAKSITVNLPQNCPLNEPYALTESDIVLPPDTYLAEPLNLTLTVVSVK